MTLSPIIVGTGSLTPTINGVGRSNVTLCDVYGVPIPHNNNRHHNRRNNNA